MIITLGKYRYTLRDAMKKIIKDFCFNLLFPLNALFLILLIAAGVSLSIIKFWLSISIIVLLSIIYYIVLFDEYLLDLKKMFFYS